MAFSKAPTFTVVIPLYNKAAHIDATLAAIAAQTFTDYEVVVVDDGSTDDGPVKVMAAGHDTRLICQANAGPGVARNRGVAAARGTWVAFLDADDVWHPDHLATLADTIAHCPIADVVATGFMRADSPAATIALADNIMRYCDFFLEHHLIWTSAAAVRTAALRKVPFGAVWPGEDVDLWLRLAMQHKIAVSSKKTATYIQRTGGVMDNYTEIVPIQHQPVFITIDKTISYEKNEEKQKRLIYLRSKLLLEYVKPSLFNGQSKLARHYIAALKESGASAPILYKVLAHFPGAITKVGSRWYGAIKRMR